ncbi:hypothetical protein JCM3765_003811 [Sporobolomyces pararoseus]
MNQPSSYHSNRSYSILITLYDPSLLSNPPPPSSGTTTLHHLNPLIPNTPTRLPFELDSKFSKSLNQQGLVLLPPSSSIKFWDLNLNSIPTRELPPSKKSPSSSNQQQQEGGGGEGVTIKNSTTTRRIWSQNFGEFEQLYNSNLKLWTPSQALPPTTSSTSTPPRKKEAILDFRFGPLSIDWIKIKIMEKENTPPSEEQVGGTTLLNWGTLHLYREAGASSSSSSTQEDQEDDDGKTLGMVSVPGNLNASSILKFLNNDNSSSSSSEGEKGEGWLENIEEIRMLRDSTPSRSIVLLKFKSKEKASKFHKIFNGKKYYESSKDSEICQLVSISKILLKSTSLPPYTFPLSPDPSLKPPKSSSKQQQQPQQRTEEEVKEEREIPLCPICLEKLDSKVTGLVQISCKHSYHCNCLLRWGDSRCPVCRATNLKPSINDNKEEEEEQAEEARIRNCTICTSPSNLWICLICSNVGCGRYQGGHAFTHFLESGHSYSLELQTGRIWSYTDDEYVHRLLRVPSSTFNNSNPNGGAGGGAARLIELPSLPSHHHQVEDISQKIANSYRDDQDEGEGGGPNKSTEEEQSKLELIALEYSSLLSSNLFEQREYFEEELSRIRKVSQGWEKKVLELELVLEEKKKEFEFEKKQFKSLQIEKDLELKGLKDRLGVLEKDLKRNEEDRKKEKNESNKLRKSLEKELEMEKSVTSNLTDNLGNMKKEIEIRRNETEQVRGEVEELKDQLNDLMAALTMRDKIEQEPEGSELRGASIGVAAQANQGTGNEKSPSQVLRDKRKKKTKKK